MPSCSAGGGPAFISANSDLFVIGVSSYQISHMAIKRHYGVGEYYTGFIFVPWLTQTMNKAADPVIASHPAIDAISVDDHSAFNAALSGGSFNFDILAKVLYQIVMQDKPTFATTLLNHDIDFMAVTINHHSPFEFALRQGRTAIVDVFMAHTAKRQVKHRQDSAILPPTTWLTIETHPISLRGLNNY